ncbi:uncharacterized protein B0H64DRAFT_39951 [Chaetomium fimeti]|uniref:Uncharacterized protein n=1 Tax=Chaetomium fimeti TaxID=1854472 RepID=A0AAE0HRP2_9PEZI|nr:hypothetical protein B0H64DRAFT_39951 [Chaetomium fimeti]
MCQAPADDVARGMLGPVVPDDVALENLQLVPSVRPMRIYEVLLPDRKTLHLVLPPVSMWRPLRAEQGMLTSEAIAVRWIRETIARVTSVGEQKESSSSSASRNITTSLLPFLPTLLRLGRETHAPNSSFAVYEPVSGTPLSLFSSEPAPTARREIDHQLGALFRDLSTLTSPTGRFGPLAAVVDTGSGTGTSKPPAPAGKRPRLPQLLTESGLSATGGAGTWSVAFHSMLEGVLRDGEDMAVVVSYSTIRRQFRRLGYLLDDVTTGRLVVVEGVGRGNVLVEEVGGQQEKDVKQEKEGDDNGPDGGKNKGKAIDQKASVKKEDDTEKEDVTEKGEAGATQEKNDTQPQQNLKLTGLRDWSSAIFGDPLLATVFSDPHQPLPSSAFLEGFNDEKPNSDRDSRHAQLPYPLNPTIIENVDTAGVRLLFYQVYHTVTRIVSEFYRPRQDSSARELEARKKLNEVLTKLAEVPDNTKKRHQRPSGEMSPAKRLRGAEDE